MMWWYGIPVGDARARGYDGGGIDIRGGGGGGGPGVSLR